MQTDETHHAAITKRLRHPLPRARVPGLPALPLTTRVLLLTFGWLLTLVGILGLVLPGIQGILTIALGTAALSLVSRTILGMLRFVMRPWPKAWRAFLRTRRKIDRCFIKEH